LPDTQGAKILITDPCSGEARSVLGEQGSTAELEKVNREVRANL
jgi:hypothetical protein